MNRRLDGPQYGSQTNYEGREITTEVALRELHGWLVMVTVGPGNCSDENWLGKWWQNEKTIYHYVEVEESETFDVSSGCAAYAAGPAFAVPTLMGIQLQRIVCCTTFLSAES